MGVFDMVLLLDLRKIWAVGRAVDYCGGERARARGGDADPSSSSFIHLCRLKFRILIRLDGLQQQHRCASYNNSRPFLRQRLSCL